MRLDRLTTAIAIVGGLLMLAAATMVAVSVTLRQTAGTAVAGDYEIVQMVTALAAFTFLPLCQIRRGNILVDTFTTRLPGAVQRGLDALWDLVYAGIAAVIAWQLMQGAIGTIRSHTVSMILALPVGWVIAACSILAGLLSLVALMTSIRRLRSAT